MLPITYPLTQSLGVDEWQSLGINSAAFHLSELLMRPGKENVSIFKHLFGAFDTKFLNASMPAWGKVKDNQICFRSVIDGALCCYDLVDCLSIAREINAKYCLLPALMNKEKLEKILAIDDIGFLLPYDLPCLVDMDENMFSGFYYMVNMTNFDKIADYIEKQQLISPNKWHYVIGELTLKDSLFLIKKGATHVENKLPVTEAYTGKLYTQKGMITITACKHALSIKPVDDNCTCYCCKYFTQSYLHHLFVHTPLLSKRLQIIHNMHFLLNCVVT